MNKFLKITIVSVNIAIILSLVFAMASYTPAAERNPQTHYSSIGETFIFMMFYIIPLTLVVSTAAYIFYKIIGKMTRLSRLPKVGLSLLAAVSLIALTFYALMENNKTNDLYLIPEGYEGDVLVFYNVKGAPRVKTEKGYDVHMINEQGYSATPTPDMDYGTVTDLYYYVDKNGNRTPINEKCISGFGTSGYSTSRNTEIDLHFTGFRLTRDQCSDEFRTENHGMEEGKQRMVAEILKTYYGLVDGDGW